MFKYIQTVICAFTLIFLCALQVHSQEAPAGADKNIVKGRVVDKKTNLPVSDVSVTEIDADDRVIKGTQTDIEGNFVLRVSNPKNRISISYIGYKSIVQGLNGRTSFNFQIEDVNASLGEVVVVSSRKVDNGMMAISERLSTHATSRVSVKEVEEMQAASIDQALQGRLSGVDITATTGDPGAAMNIRIRGISSISRAGHPRSGVDGLPRSDGPYCGPSDAQ